MNRDRVMEVLSVDQLAQHTREAVDTGIHAFPRVDYASDGEEDDNGPNGAPFQALEADDPAFLRRLMALGGEGNPLLREDVPENVSYVQVIEYLVRMGPTLLTAATNRELHCRNLRRLSVEIQVLRPANRREDLGDWRDRSQWQRYLGALASELTMVEHSCSSEVRDSGLYVLSNFPYGAVLWNMAEEISGHDW